MSGTPGRLRVALLSWQYGEYCVELANGLADRVELTLLLERDALAGHRERLDPRIRLVDFAMPRLREPLRQIRACRRLLATLAALGPDVVHVQQGHLWFNFWLGQLRRAQPLVVTVHDHTIHPGDRDSLKTPQAVQTRGFRRADRLIVHGGRLREEMLELGRVRAVPIDVVPHVAVGAPPSPSGSDDGVGVLFFGRIWPYKGLDVLIRAQPLVSARIPDARFVIAGRGESLDRYRRLMADPSRFQVLDEYVSDELRAELFASAALVVLPYVEASQSGVVPVAYGHGKPVVATTVGALPEIVEDGRTGLLVPPRDEVALAEAIVRLLADSELRRRLGAAGRHRLETELSPAAVAAATLAVYERACQAG